VHYRLARRDAVPSVKAKTEAIARELKLRVMQGKEVIEIRPPIDVHKGSASIELVERFGALRDGASILCIGDDRTDEDMFRSLRARDVRAVTVRVEPNHDVRATAAEFCVSDTNAVRELLEAALALHA
jgi:trehalose-phosphatase